MERKIISELKGSFLASQLIIIKLVWYNSKFSTIYIIAEVQLKGCMLHNVYLQLSLICKSNIKSNLTIRTKTLKYTKNI